MFNLGPTELIILLLIILLLFGVGGIGRIAGELGSGIRAVREAARDERSDVQETAQQE